VSGHVVVAGATGFVGRHLVQRLLDDGVDVRCGTRDPERASAARPDWRFVRLDVGDSASLDAALAGARALVYLVHQMADHRSGLLAQEEASALRVRDAAARAGVGRIVYLGGPRPIEGEPSPHLQARLRTGEILRSGPASAIELRAGMVVGHGSESYAMCRDLALRLPVMVLPSWLRTRSEPIAIDDVVFALAHALDLELEGSRAFDLPGPEVLSARQILERIAAARGFRPVMIPVPVLTPQLSSHWLRFVTRADFDIARQLVAGLQHDLVAADEGYWENAPDHVRVPFDDAVRSALALEGSGRRSARLWERVVRGVARSA
jgi:uncharacterized protein YbjT (DUF2867 family)